MAKVKTPLFSLAATGQLGGLLYRPGTYGPIVSRRSITPALMTPAQCAQRGRLKRAHTAWMALTDADRAAWEAFASHPETGRNAYIRAFTILNKIGYAPDTDPRNIAPTGAISALTAVWGPPPTSIARLTWSYTGTPTVEAVAYALSTWSHRACPKPSKLLYRAHTLAYQASLYITLPYRAPITWFRLELRSATTAILLGSHLISLPS